MKEYSHQDKLGSDIKVGKVVAYPDQNSLMIGTVTKINPKMIGITSIGRFCGKYNKYPRDCVLVDEQLAMLYILKNQ